MNFRELMLYQFREEKRIENRVEDEEDEACVWFIECDIAQKYEQPFEIKKFTQVCFSILLFN